MTRHMIVGAGPVGSAVARELLARGEQVRVVTRSGSGIDGVEKVRCDAGDAARLSELARGSAVIYNCANPPYTSWTTDWPPIAAALLAAAESSGATLAITGNLYSYGPVSRPMTETTPENPSSIKGAVRKTMWQDALAAQRAGRLTRVLEVRGSDYIGEGPSVLTLLVMPSWAKGRTARVPADLDAPHTWTNPGDMGRLLVTAVTDDRGANQIWHTPSAPAISVRELAARAAAVAGREPGKLASLPGWVLRAASLFNKQAREFAEMNYQFRRPFVLDTSYTEAVFGPGYTPLDESLRQNLGS